MIRVVVVDDVDLARERVRLYLADEPDIEIVGEAGNGADALRLIAGTAPDILFLDVGLPDMDGFEIARRLEAQPIIIYLTANEDRALDAFEVSALDYLTKPFDRERFRQSLNRARTLLRLKSGAKPKADYLARLAIKEKDRTDVVAVDAIDYIDVAGHYLCVHVGKQVHLIRGSLSELEERLDPAVFARVHRSAIVRLDRIKSLSTRRNGDCDVLLADGAKLVMSRSYSDGVRARLGLS
ncbi:MAG TPA: LytTR family DNA-binding domain-containing protein [Rhizomicrobium sp.]|nr:LytTR family DNA-binding domain-containing protein [Rhizomicrobium sp.]